MNLFTDAETFVRFMRLVHIPAERGQCWLTAGEVLEIRRLADCGMTQPSIAEKFGVARQQIGRIVRRENWGHV